VHFILLVTKQILIDRKNFRNFLPKHEGSFSNYSKVKSVSRTITEVALGV